MTGSRTTNPQAWVVWGVGVIAYTVAVLQRTSLAVVGNEAADRFGTSATVIGTFAVVQLLVYAAMQVPVGVLLDRFGSKRLLLAGALLMVAGQVALAVATSVPQALAARVLVGTGDALTFISVLRLVPAWFPARRVPMLTQVTGMLGQLGQVASAIPLVALLNGPGWTPAFLAAASLGALSAVLVIAVVKESPDGVEAGREPRPLRRVGTEVAEAAGTSGTRLGLWTHFTVQFAGAVFALLWGFPFLTAGHGLEPREAAGLLTVMVLAGIVTGPVIGRLTSRHPLHRSTLVLGIIAVTAAAWTVVLLWPGPAPMAVLVGLVLVLAMNGPASLIGLDFARTFNPPDRLGSATGIVNIGGFLASLLTILAIGVVLDVVTPAGARYGLEELRLAFAVQYVVWAVGAAGIVVNRRRVRRELAAQGTVVLPVREAWRARRHRLDRAA